jgi:hypothetical protein
VSVASFNDLMVQIYRLIDGDDVSISEIPLATVKQIIGLAERRIYRDIRSRHNEKAFASVTSTSNLATIPDDFEAVSVVIIDGYALEPVSEEWLIEYLRCVPAGVCRYFSEAGDSLKFGPALTDGTAVDGRYFYRHADLSQATFATNTLLANEPDVFIYGALVEAGPWFPGAAQKAATFNAKYESIKERINTAKENTAANAARLIRRSATKLIG